jgi:transposase-like protein
MQSVSDGPGSASDEGSDRTQEAITVDAEKVGSHLDEVVRSTVEQALNTCLTRRPIHAKEDRPNAEQKAAQVVEKLETMRLGRAAEILRSGVDETLKYMSFPREHWRCIRTNNPLERLNREVRRRSRVVGAFPTASRR